MLTVGDVTIDVDEHRLVVGGKEIRLTPKEFDVLKYLVHNAGKVVTHRALLQKVWDGSPQIKPNTCGFSYQLRRKIEIDASHPRYLITEPWGGLPVCTE